MEKKLQIFVSSTYSDLITERQATVEAILTEGHIPAGMELFAAGDETQLNIIKRWIDESDIFMLLLGGRYGSIEPKSGKSYIQLEYEYAIEKKKPVFAIRLSDNFIDRKLKTHGRGVIEERHPEEYRKFKDIVLQRMCPSCDDENHIKWEISKSLKYFLKDEYYKFPAWVRGQELLNVMDELSKTKKENESLHIEVEECKKSNQSIRKALAKKTLSKSVFEPHLLEAFEKSGLKSAFRIKIENPQRDVRIKELVQEELTIVGEKKFRLAASSGANYLNPDGKVWGQAGLGKAVLSGQAEFIVVLESPFSSFAITRALANRVTHHQWQEKIFVEEIRKLTKEHKNITIKVTEQAVNCSLFFTSKAVFYDPYLWARRDIALRTENSFWVLEFRKIDDPNYDYECYNLLEKHFEFLLSTSIPLREFLGENNERYIRETAEFQKTMESLLKNYGYL